MANKLPCPNFVAEHHVFEVIVTLIKAIQPRSQKEFSYHKKALSDISLANSQPQDIHWVTEDVRKHLEPLVVMLTQGSYEFITLDNPTEAQLKEARAYIRQEIRYYKDLLVAIDRGNIEAFVDYSLEQLEDEINDLVSQDTDAATYNKLTAIYKASIAQVILLSDQQLEEISAQANIKPIQTETELQKMERKEKILETQCAMIADFVKQSIASTDTTEVTQKALALYDPNLLMPILDSLAYNAYSFVSGEQSSENAVIQKHLQQTLAKARQTFRDELRIHNQHWQPALPEDIVAHRALALKAQAEMQSKLQSQIQRHSRASNPALQHSISETIVSDFLNPLFTREGLERAISHGEIEANEYGFFNRCGAIVESYYSQKTLAEAYIRIQSHWLDHYREQPTRNPLRDWTRLLLVCCNIELLPLIKRQGEEETQQSNPDGIFTLNDFIDYFNEHGFERFSKISSFCRKHPKLLKLMQAKGFARLLTVMNKQDVIEALYQGNAKTQILQPARLLNNDSMFYIAEYCGITHEELVAFAQEQDSNTIIQQIEMLMPIFSYLSYLTSAISTLLMMEKDYLMHSLIHYWIKPPAETQSNQTKGSPVIQPERVTLEPNIPRLALGTYKQSDSTEEQDILENIMLRQA